MQNDQNVIENERRSVREVHVLRERRRQKPNACPQRASKEEPEQPENDIWEQRFDRVFAVDLKRRKNEKEDPERGYDTEYQRKSAGGCRTNPLAEDIARNACPREVWL